MENVKAATAQNATASLKPVSQKKEFEHLLRSIKSIAAKTRVFSGEMVQELTKQAESSASSQKTWSSIASLAQFAILGGTLGYGVWKSYAAKDVFDLMQSNSKISDLGKQANDIFQISYQSESQRNQQATTHYNTFDGRMQSIVQSIETAQQRLQQKEMEEASNR